MTESTSLEKQIAHIWRSLAIRGIASIAFGVLIVAWPGIGLSVLIALVAAFALVDGTTTVVGAIRTPTAASQRIWLALTGLVGIAAGVVIVVWPGLSALALLYAIAAWTITTGVLQLGAALALPFSGGRSLWLLLGGAVSIAFGVIMFAKPGAGALALLALISAFAIVTGLFEVAFAIELRGTVGEVRRRAKKLFGPPRVVTHG